MNFYSLNKQAPEVSFKEAVLKGLASDKGLYFPTSIKPLPNSFFKSIGDLSYEEIRFLKLFINLLQQKFQMRT